MPIPDTLQGKLELWHETARVEKYSKGLFYNASWVALYLGQGVLPMHHDARATLPDPMRIVQAMENARANARRNDGHNAWPSRVPGIERERLAEVS